MSAGKCIIFSAPSGAGKTTIVHYLLQKFDVLEFSVSACSRSKRKNEQNGIDYYFLTVDEFRKKINNSESLEREEVYKDNYYGTLKSEIDRIWNNHKSVIFDVDVVGGLNLKKYFGDKALSIFVKAPSLLHLQKRLETRETETAESIARRMDKAQKEMQFAQQFDYVLINDNLQYAFAEAEKVVGEFLNKNK